MKQKLRSFLIKLKFLLFITKKKFPRFSILKCISIGDGATSRIWKIVLGTTFVKRLKLTSNEYKWFREQNSIMIVFNKILDLYQNFDIFCLFLFKI